MALVQQMLDTKQKEIQKLEEHTNMRKEGLACSEKMLAQDTSSFIQFFNSIKEETQKAAKQLEDKKKQKNNRVNELRKLSDNNQMLISQINKNLDNLLINYEYKEFLDIVQKSHAEEFKQLEADKVELKQQETATLRSRVSAAGRTTNKKEKEQ